MNKQNGIKNLKLTGASVTALGVMSVTNGPAFAHDDLAWDKTFPPSDELTVEKVSHVNRLGINIVGDMYAPKHEGRRSPDPFRCEALARCDSDHAHDPPRHSGAA